MTTTNDRQLPHALVRNLNMTEAQAQKLRETFANNFPNLVRHMEGTTERPAPKIDLYIKLAAVKFKVAEADVSPPQRNNVKNELFAWAYGSGALKSKKGEFLVEILGRWGATEDQVADVFTFWRAHHG